MLGPLVYESISNFIYDERVEESHFFIKNEFYVFYSKNLECEMEHLFICDMLYPHESEKMKKF